MSEPHGGRNLRSSKRKREEYEADDDDYEPALPSNVKRQFAELIDAKASDLLDTVNLYMKDKELAEYFFKDDDAAKEARDYYQRARDYAPKYKTPHKGKRTTKRKLPQAGVQRTFKDIREDHELGFPGDPDDGSELTGVGLWREGIQVSQPAERDAAYDLILLNMIAQVFLNHVKSVEIEAMCVADRVVVSANDIGEIPDIQAKALVEAIETVPSKIKQKGKKFADLYQWQINKHIDIKQLRSSLRTGQDPSGHVLDIVTAANMFPESYQATVSALKIIAADTVKNVRTTPDGLGGFLTDDQYVSSIIVVDPLPHSHAEQNLMLGLLKSGYNKNANVSIAGGKRPCTICYLSLCLTKEKYPNLHYGVRPGGMYMAETKRGLTEICLARDIDEPLLKEKAKYYLGAEYQQFITRYKELDEAGMAQTIAREGYEVTDEHRELAREIATTQVLPRGETAALKGWEKQGLSSKQPTFALHPDFDRSSFGEYVDTGDMEMDDESEDGSDDERNAPKGQEEVHTIASTEKLTELLARASKSGWHHVLVKNGDPKVPLTISGDADVKVRLKAGSNVIVNDQRTVEIDDDGVKVQLLDGQLSMEDFHETAVEIAGSGSAALFTKGQSRVLVRDGILQIRGMDAGNLANVELHGGEVYAHEHTVITKVGAGRAVVELLSPHVRIGPSALLGGIELRTNGFTPQVV
jgi:hypothetical protein